ncbi:MAG TPA: hypothetical protein VEB22_15375 [Phycisphaerales bacterium]|nr:hypothetical protein [Phycisphaerales bacterium]
MPRATADLVAEIEAGLVPLEPNPVDAPGAVPEVVAQLEYWLAEARAGRVLAVAIAGVLPDRHTAHSFELAAQDLPPLHYAASTLAFSILAYSAPDDSASPDEEA